MANDAKVVCKNVFKNCDKAVFTKAFTLKWIELINQYEKNKGRATPARCETNYPTRCYNNIM